MGNVSVVGYRQLIEPPELGECQDPDCITVSAIESRTRWPGGAPPPSSQLLLVAMYGSREAGWTRVCSTCDERRLRAWLAD